MFKSRFVRVVSLVVVLAMMLALLPGCGNTSKNSSNSGTSSVSDNNPPSSPPEGKPNGSDVSEYAVKLTYANYDYIESGDDSRDKLIRNVDSTVFGSPDSTDRIAALIEKLRKTPEGVPNAETLVTDIFRIKSVSLKLADGTCTIDLDGKKVQSAGMYDEVFFVYQTVDSILNSFSDVTSVRFTLDGKTVDTLNNYMDISQPFTAADVEAFSDNKAVTVQS